MVHDISISISTSMYEFCGPICACFNILCSCSLKVEMAQDPFLEAGITIPTELPYKEGAHRDISSRK